MEQFEYQGKQYTVYREGEVMHTASLKAGDLVVTNSNSLFQYDGSNWTQLSKEQGGHILKSHKAEEKEKTTDNSDVIYHADLEHAGEKMTAFEKVLNINLLQQAWFIRKVTPNSQVYVTNPDGSSSSLTGTYFEYQPDNIPNDTRAVYQWANTASPDSMKRCHRCCSTGRWKAIIQYLNLTYNP